MLTIDAQARSSMWDDLKQGRRTEIDAFQGAIIRLARTLWQANSAQCSTEKTDP